MNILIIDNNDSFTVNLKHLIAIRTGSDPVVAPYDSLKCQDLSACDLVVISPGPGKPSEYPDYAGLMEGKKPVLGICLGMQIMGEYFGGEVAPLIGCIHGRAESILFDGRLCQVARYHSLYLANVPDCFQIIAENDAGVPMAIRHKSRPLVGYQFHPESFLTGDGGRFIDYALDIFS